MRSFPFKNLNLLLFFRNLSIMVSNFYILYLFFTLKCSITNHYGKVNEKCYFTVCVGGVLFKVYIVGDAIKVVRRFSLPDVSKWELSKDAGIYNFPRVSCAAASADDADLDPTVAGNYRVLSFYRSLLSKNKQVFTILPPLVREKTRPCLIHSQT